MHVRRGPATGLRLLACLVLLAGAVGALPVGAEARGPKGAPGRIVERHAERLGLSAQTRAELERVVAESGRQHAELEARIEAERSRLRELLTEPSPDRNAVMARAERLGELTAQRYPLRLEAILEIRALLTAAQREELVRILEERREARRQAPRRGPWAHCADDLATLCPEAEAQGPPARLACLAERWNQLSAPCRKALDPAATARARPRR